MTLLFAFIGGAYCIPHVEQTIKQYVLLRIGGSRKVQEVSVYQEAHVSGE